MLADGNLGLDFTMLAIVLKRSLSAVPLLFFVSILAFLLMKAIPGDPVDVLLGSSEKDLSSQQVQLLRQQMGLDQPLPKQYLTWVSGWWGAGELGRSYRDGRPVLEVINERLGNTFLLVFVSLLFSFGVGISVGLALAFAASTRWRALSHLLLPVVLFFYCAPSFWLAFLAISAVQAWLPGWPILGMHDPGRSTTLFSLMQHVVLPALLLSSRKSAKVALFVRAMVLEQAGRDYVLVARSKGLSQPAVLFRHVLRNSLIPVIALLGLALPALFGGAVLIETVFGISGLGRLAVEATFGRNYPVMMGLIVIYGSVVIVSNLIADILYCLVDPRVKEEMESGGLSQSIVRVGAA
jgi:peptide/nickel transport system permease protein